MDKLYSMTYTVKLSEGDELELKVLKSDTPFPAIHKGDFIHAAFLPSAGDLETKRYKVEEVTHISQDLEGTIFHYTLVLMIPEQDVPKYVCRWQPLPN